MKKQSGDWTGQRVAGTDRSRARKRTVVDKLSTFVQAEECTVGLDFSSRNFML